MTTRRTFLKTAAMASAGLYASSSAMAFFGKQKYIGLQLYTVRDAMKDNPQAALAKVAEIGFTAVETATYTGTQLFYGMDAKTFAATLKQNGLIAPSGHYMLGLQKMNGMETKGTILHEWDKAVDDAAEAGIKYMVCAYLFPDERGTIDHYKEMAGQFNEAAERCKKAGIQFCYHNHDFEFEAQNGVLPYDILLKETDKGLVKMELDLYWATKAGHDPVELFKANPGRFALWHVKDMDNTPAHAFTEVGNGVIDFKKIFAAAKTSGMQYFFVEQDKCPGSPYDSITQSITYIKKNIL